MNYRRSQTAEMAKRGRPDKNDNREREFFKAEREEEECFGRLLEKLGLE